ncbi:MAG: GNAT family N-acyltransferase [Pseudomonadota bacterium]
MSTSAVPDQTAAPAVAAKLASSPEEIEACQALRFRVFYEDGGAKADALSLSRKLDADGYDEICDHLMVTAGEHAVGTYRLLRQEQLPEGMRFYSQAEFDLEPLLERKRSLNFLELGRSCVLPEYRTKGVIEVLWQSIWNYVRAHKLDVMLGCASLPPGAGAELNVALNYLRAFHAAPPEWSAKVHRHCAAAMEPLAEDAFRPRAAFEALPPLVKGYLRLGAHVGEGAARDEQFNTTDVLIVLPVSAIRPRYFARFGAPDEAPQPLMS